MSQGRTLSDILQWVAGWAWACSRLYTDHSSICCVVSLHLVPWFLNFVTSVVGLLLQAAAVAACGKVGRWEADQLTACAIGAARPYCCHLHMFF
jgi:hypothetical protein